MLSRIMKPDSCGFIVLIEMFFMFQFTASEVGPGPGQNKSRLTNFHDNNCLLSCHYRKKLQAAVGFLDGQIIFKTKNIISIDHKTENQNIFFFNQNIWIEIESPSVTRITT